jgi:hypothetical protein
METKNIAQKLERQVGTRGVTEMERLHFVSILAERDGANASQYILKSVNEAVARDIDVDPSFLQQIRMTDSEVFELARTLSREDGITTAEYIRGAVLRSVADDICISVSHLNQVLEKAESWEPSWC